MVERKERLKEYSPCSFVLLHLTKKMNKLCPSAIGRTVFSSTVIGQRVDEILTTPPYLPLPPSPFTQVRPAYQGLAGCKTLLADRMNWSRRPGHTPVSLMSVEG